MTIFFETPSSDKTVLEEGTVLSPRFDSAGLVTAVVADATDNEVLMLAHMNAQALQLTIETGIAHYWSRSRNSSLEKGRDLGQPANGRGHPRRLRPGRRPAQGPRCRQRCNLPHRPPLLLLPESGSAKRHTRLGHQAEPLFDPATVYGKK
jgi:hypothetical protein